MDSTDNMSVIIIRISSGIGYGEQNEYQIGKFTANCNETIMEVIDAFKTHGKRFGIDVITENEDVVKRQAADERRKCEIDWLAANQIITIIPF